MVSSELVGRNGFFILIYTTEAADDPAARHHLRNHRALAAYNRVQDKLSGRDFNREVSLSVQAQVEKLIQQATSLENLCQCFSGWCAFW